MYFSAMHCLGVIFGIVLGVVSGIAPRIVLGNILAPLFVDRTACQRAAVWAKLKTFKLKLSVGSALPEIVDETRDRNHQTLQTR
jgi:hypothetical protein